MSSTNWWQHDSDASRQEADGPPPPPPSTSGLNTEWTWSTPNQDGSGLRTAPPRAGGSHASSFEHDDLPVKGPMSALRAGVENITNYQGRATRPEFWWLWLMMLVIHFGTAFVIEFLVLADALTVSAAGLAYLGVLLGTFAIMLPAAVRRMHDSNQVGIWAVVPLVNVILLLMPPDPTTNRFGPPR